MKPKLVILNTAIVIVSLKKGSNNTIPFRSTRKLKCSASFRLSAFEGRSHILKVSQFHGEHQNHPCTSEFVENLPLRRRLTDTEKIWGLNNGRYPWLAYGYSWWNDYNCEGPRKLKVRWNFLSNACLPRPRLLVLTLLPSFIWYMVTFLYSNESNDGMLKRHTSWHLANVYDYLLF